MNKIPTEDHIKEVEQDDRIIQFDAGEVVSEPLTIAVDTTENVSDEDFLKIHEELHRLAKDEHLFNKASDMHVNSRVRLRQSIDLPDLDEESKRSDRFFGMRLDKSTDDIENTFLVMFAEFVSLMALLIGTLGFGVLLWAIFS
jgi:hypothetical protein